MFRINKIIWLWLLVCVAGCSSEAPKKCTNPNFEVPNFDEDGEGKALPTPKRMVVMLDYSGSMCPGWKPKKEEIQDIPDCEKCVKKARSKCLNQFYYGLPDFTDHLAGWLDAASPAGQEMFVEFMLFNNSVWHFDPSKAEAVKFQKQALTFGDYDLGSAGLDQIKTWVDAIPDNPYKVHLTDPNDTLMKEALMEAIEAVEEDTMIWLITDNILDEPLDDAHSEEAQRNKAFYDYLNSESRIQAIASYPMSSQESCHFISLFQRSPSCGSSNSGTEPLMSRATWGAFSEEEMYNP